MANNETLLRYAMILAFAILTYALVYVISNYGLKGFGIDVYDWSFDSKSYSPMYGFAPIAGFVLVFFGLMYWQRRFKESHAVMALLFVAFVFASLFAFWLNLWFFYSDSASAVFEQTKNEIVAMYGQDALKSFYTRYNVCISACQIEGGFDCKNLVDEKQNKITLLCEINYFNEFKRSAFLPFLISGIFAGLCFFVYDFIVRHLKKSKGK